MKRSILFFVLLICLSCKNEKQPGFSFSGATSNIEDGTILLLDDTETRSILDSTTVKNNKFEFKGDLPKSPLQVVLRTENFSHYRYVWLENTTMTFDARKSDFKTAPITGSDSEDLSQYLRETISKVEPHSKEQRKIEQKFVSNNPNSILSASMLSTYSTTWGKETTQNLFNKFSPENKNSLYGQRISNYIKLNKEPKIGESYIDFAMADQNGKNTKFSNHKNKLTLLEFWASWCSPCRKENPNLVKTYNKFNSKGFEVVAVSIDKDKESWLNAIKKDNLNWKHLSELNGDVNTAGLIYGVAGIPDNFLIDENGIIVGRNLRGEELNKKIEEIIGDSK